MGAGPAKVLIITYYWPPSGGAGVQRWLKFSKYLPLSGWMPVVLTVRPESAAYPYRDNSLSAGVSGEVAVHRTRAVNWFALYNRDRSRVPHSGFASGAGGGVTAAAGRFLRGNLFIPDPRRGWNRYAFRKAKELIRKEHIREVITTGPPHSTHLIGLRLKRRMPHLRWVADMRDPWTGIYYYEMFRPSWPARALDRRLEQRVLQGADMITTVGHGLASHLAERAGESDKIYVLPNGYDEDDFLAATSSATATPSVTDTPSVTVTSPVTDISSLPKRVTITYVGTLSGAYPVTGLLKAVSGLKFNDQPVVLRFTGTVPEKIRSLMKDGDTGIATEFISYCDHTEAIGHMMSSSMLLLIIPDHRSARLIVTGKVFEYLASGKPILMLGPWDGDAARILEECGHHGIFDYDDVKGIREFIREVAEGRNPAPNNNHRKYSRQKITEELAALLDTL